MGGGWCWWGEGVEKEESMGQEMNWLLSAWGCGGRSVEAHAHPACTPSPSIAPKHPLYCPQASPALPLLCCCLMPTNA